MTYAKGTLENFTRVASPPSLPPTFQNAPPPLREPLLLVNLILLQEIKQRFFLTELASSIIKTSPSIRNKDLFIYGCTSSIIKTSPSIKSKIGNINSAQNFSHGKTSSSISNGTEDPFTWMYFFYWYRLSIPYGTENKLRSNEWTIDNASLSIRNTTQDHGSHMDVLLLLVKLALLQGIKQWILNMKEN